MSSEATYKVEKSEEPTPKPSKKGCNGGSYQAIWYVVKFRTCSSIKEEKIILIN